MPSYKSRPCIIEAEQWFPESSKHKGVYYDKILNCYYVITIHNQISFLESGDYIITEPDGIHYYACKAEIFRSKYELLKYESTKVT